MHPQQKTNYTTLVLPLKYDKSFLDLSEHDILVYYNWFLGIKSLRLDMLCKLLFKNPKTSLSEESVNTLEIFLFNSIFITDKSQTEFNLEKRNIPEHLKPYATIDTYVFTDETISICYDIGIFLGELLIKIEPSVHWALERDNNYADYGQPVLVRNRSKFSVNPFRVAKNVAGKMCDGTYTDGLLLSYFNAWKKAFGIA